MGPGFWLHVEVLQSLYFWGEKVPSLLFYVETGNKPLKFGKIENLQKNRKTSEGIWTQPYKSRVRCPYHYTMTTNLQIKFIFWKSILGSIDIRLIPNVNLHCAGRERNQF